jgi:CspA family cold shock protein
MKGIVKMYDGDRRYGFLVTDAGSRVFFHASQLEKDGFEEKPAQGERLEFDLEFSDRGPRAVNIARA